VIGALRRHSSASAIAAGLIAVLVAYTGPLAIVVQAARAAGLPDATLSSWIWAFSVGSGVTGIALSAWFRAPVVVAWSTPGAALLVTALPLYSFPQAVGAYLLAAALMIVVGATGLFARAMDRIPPGIVAAMLAGILFKFAAAAVTSIAGWPGLVLPMIAAFFAARRLAPRHAVAVTLLVGAAIVWASGRLEAAAALRPALAVPVVTWPELSGRALVGLGLPLFLVTLTSQNATGVAVLRAAGYDVPASPLVTATGIASLLLAPFGCHGVNLAAITAAICTGPEAHPDPRRRWVAGVACGAFYLVVGAFGATVALAFGALPDPLIATVGGLALLGAMTAGLTAATREEGTREGAMATFVVTASGVSFFGIGAAFWGLVAGAAVHGVATWRGRRAGRAPVPAQAETGSRGG
jgi:benzoate membrane transport protein